MQWFILCSELFCSNSKGVRCIVYCVLLEMGQGLTLLNNADINIMLVYMNTISN